MFDQITAARAAGDTTALERALKWHLVLHDMLLRGPFRSTRGGGRRVQILAQRFQAWRDGDRVRLMQWWRQDRASAFRTDG